MSMKQMTVALLIATVAAIAGVADFVAFPSVKCPNQKDILYLAYPMRDAQDGQSSPPVMGLRTRLHAIMTSIRLVVVCG